MAYLAVDFAIKTMSRKRWRFCKAPSLLRRWETQIAAENEMKIVTATELIDDERQNWFK